MSEVSSWYTRKQQAFLLARNKQVPAALRLCQELHREQPDDGEVLRALAVLYVQDGDFRGAESSARGLVALQPTAASSHLALTDVLLAAGRPGDAENCLRTALAQYPKQARLWLRLGNLLSAGEASDEAGRCLERAVELDLYSPEAQHDYAVWLQSAGRLGDAVLHYRRAVALQPESVRLLCDLGSALHAYQARQPAAECFRQALHLSPDQPPALLGLANVYFDGGDFAAAALRYRQLVEQDTTHIEAHLGLGLAYQQLGRPQDALHCFRRLTELQPADPAHGLRLGHLCLELARHDEALAVFARAQTLAPRDTAIAAGTGLALQHLGRLDDALAHIQRLEQQKPDSEIDLAVMRATIFERMGDYDKAWAVVATRFGRDGVAPGTVVLASRVCHRVGECERVVPVLKALLADEQVSDSERRGLYFALGALQDRLGNYDAAFAAYAAGNDLKRMGYSEGKDAAFVTSLAAVFDSNRYRVMQPASGTGQVPVFIVGMPRSGTSLLEQILCSHPQVVGAGESLALGRLVERLGDITGTDSVFPEAVLHLDATTLATLADEYLAELTTGAPAALRVTDKMPHNFAYIGLIRLMFPDARIIHCVRDPVDTCLSCYFQDFSGFHNYAYDLLHLGGHYLQYRKIMHLWAETLKIPMLEMSYENLVEQPEEQVRTLLDYCGLAWDDACLRFHESGRTIRTASYNQVRTPLYATSYGRWRNYHKHLGPLLEKLGLTDRQAPAL